MNFALKESNFLDSRTNQTYGSGRERFADLEVKEL
jgi:hypothetical protein